MRNSEELEKKEPYADDDLWNPSQMVAECSFFADGAFPKGFFPSSTRPAVRGKNDCAARYKNALEDFINLEQDDQRRVKDFQEQYADLDPPFVPASWFTRQLGGNQNTAQQVPFWIAYRNLLRAAWYSRFHDVYIPRLIGAPFTVPGQQERSDVSDPIAQGLSIPALSRDAKYLPMFPLQSVILWLIRADWRAKICERCRRFFIAEKPASRFHNQTCATKYRQEYKAQSERERRRLHGAEIASSRREDYRRNKKGKVRRYRRSQKNALGDSIHAKRGTR